MDIVTHALTGAATGAAFGRPLLGAVVAVVPDSALWLRPRLARPPALYRAAHTLLAAWSAGIITLLLTADNGAIAGCVLWAWLSHIVLDFFTHAGEWAVRPFYGMSNWHPKIFQEWEWLNRSWWLGLTIAIIWSTICLALSSSVTGFLL